MTVPPPKYLFLLTVSGTIKRIHLMAFQAIVITFGLWLYSGAGQFATAQDIFGRIAGTITDSSGGAVQGMQPLLRADLRRQPNATQARDCDSVGRGQPRRFGGGVTW